MTTDDIKQWTLNRSDSVAFHFNPGLDEYEQTYIYRSFFYAGSHLIPSHLS